jgi:hypothetical protein
VEIYLMLFEKYFQSTLLKKQKSNSILIHYLLLDIDFLLKTTGALSVG